MPDATTIIPSVTRREVKAVTGSSLRVSGLGVLQSYSRGKAVPIQRETRFASYAPLGEEPVRG